MNLGELGPLLEERELDPFRDVHPSIPSEHGGFVAEDKFPTLHRADEVEVGEVLSRRAADLDRRAFDLDRDRVRPRANLRFRSCSS